MMNGLLPGMGMFPGMNPQNDDASDEEEEENDGGVPLPPCYTQQTTNFSTPEGLRLAQKTSNEIGKSLAFTPIMESLQPIIMGFFMRRAIFMLINTFITLFTNCFKALSILVSLDPRVLVQHRIIAMFGAIGLCVAITYLASSSGFLTDEVTIVKNEKPMLFRVLE